MFPNMYVPKPTSCRYKLSRRRSLNTSIAGTQAVMFVAASARQLMAWRSAC